MFKRVGQFFGNIKLTTMIVALVISAIILAVAAISGAIYVNLGMSTRSLAATQQITNLKAAASVVQGTLPAAEVKWAEDGSIASTRAFMAENAAFTTLATSRSPN